MHALKNITNCNMSVITNSDPKTLYTTVYKVLPTRGWLGTVKYTFCKQNDEMPQSLCDCGQSKMGQLKLKLIATDSTTNH